MDTVWRQYLLSIHRVFAPMKSKYHLLNKICIITIPVDTSAKMEKSHKTLPLDEGPWEITGC